MQWLHNDLIMVSKICPISISASTSTDACKTSKLSCQAHCQCFWIT